MVTAAKIFEQMVRNMEAQRAREPWNKSRFAQNPYEMLEVRIEDWQATPEGRFAHSIKIPNAVSADSGYRPGMTQEEYFEHLCRNEAGEFIFKTVDNVDGIHQLRSRRVHTNGEWQHLYAPEDPYGYWPGEVERIGVTFVNENLYSYFEIPVHGRTKHGAEWKRLLDSSHFVEPPAGAVVARYFGNTGHSKSMKVEYDSQPRARFGFTWRGIKRPSDRDLGIAGGELIVLDLQTGEVLGVRRGFVTWYGGWTGKVCPRYGYLGGLDKSTFFTAWFVAKVARPRGWQEFFRQLEGTRRSGPR